MNYSNNEIDKTILNLALEIIERVPYWLHHRPVRAVKVSLSKCFELELAGDSSETLQENKRVLLECLKLFEAVSKSEKKAV